MVALVFNIGYDQHLHNYGMVLCSARLNTAIMVSYLARVKTNVERHEMIRISGLVHSVDTEKPHLPIVFSFVVIRIAKVIKYSYQVKWFSK